MNSWLFVAYFSLFRLFNTFKSKQTLNVNFSDDWIRTTDHCQHKQLLLKQVFAYIAFTFYLPRFHSDGLINGFFTRHLTKVDKAEYSVPLISKYVSGDRSTNCAQIIYLPNSSRALGFIFGKFYIRTRLIRAPFFPTFTLFTF